MSRILVTGGAGYLGSVLVPELLRAGHQVTVVDSFMYGQASLLDHCWNPALDVVRGDVRDEVLMRRVLKDQDVILPLAAIVGMPACDKRPFEARMVNVDAVTFLLEARRDEQRIIFPTTESGYGSQGEAPCTEDTPLHPVSLYGKLKTEAEREVLEAGNSVTLRLGTVFGMSPRMRFDLLVNDFVHRALTDRSLTLFEPHFRRNYVHVRDVARVFLFAIDHFEDMEGYEGSEGFAGCAYNVGLDTAYTKEQLCEEIKRVIPNFWYAVYTGRKGEMADPDRRDYVVSHERLKRVGFEPQTSLEDGIREIVKGCAVVSDRLWTNA